MSIASDGFRTPLIEEGYVITYGVLLSVLVMWSVLDTAGGEEVAPLPVGTELPKLSATNQDGECVDLSGYKGQKGLIIFFFPKTHPQELLKEVGVKP
jgi:hypothetical protein